MKKLISHILNLVVISYCCSLTANTIPIDSLSVNNHVCIVVKDIDKMVLFYRDVLGFKVVDSGVRTGKETEQAFGITDAKFKIYKAFSPNGHFYIEIIQFLVPDPQKIVNTSKVISSGYNHFGIEVTDVEQAYRIIVTRSNGKAISKPVTLSESGTKMFFACDPEGNRIEIFKRKQKQ